MYRRATVIHFHEHLFGSVVKIPPYAQRQHHGRGGFVTNCTNCAASRTSQIVIYRGRIERSNTFYLGIGSTANTGQFCRGSIQRDPVVCAQIGKLEFFHSVIVTNLKHISN